MEQNIEDKLGVDDLAETVALGKMSFERRFRLAANNSVLKYIQRIKIEAAKEVLKPV
jgi:transcriptional regulator GlxA family with amidase domain